MRMLRELIGSKEDFKNFRVPEASKAANYTTTWGAREDGMLLVGIHRHGYGAWTDIRDDPDLGLMEKLYLEEYRIDKKEERKQGETQVANSPGAVHLVRRADYLLSVLKAKYSNDQAAKRAVENHHRNNKKGRRPEQKAIGSGSPAPAHRQISRQDSASRHRSQSYDKGRVDRRDDSRHTPILNRHPSGETRAIKQTPKPESKPSSAISDQKTMMKAIFRPVREHLKRLQLANKEKIKSQKERALVLKRELTKIGNFIEELQTDDEISALRPQLWYAMK